MNSNQLIQQFLLQLVYARRFKNLISIIFFIQISFCLFAQSSYLSYECGLEEESLEPFEEIDECNFSSLAEKCIRVKFHYLNNTSEPSKAPSDEYFYDLLTQVNNEFAPGKIRWTFDYNCIHREDNMPLALLEQIVNHDDVLDEAEEDNNYENVFEEDENSIDIYILQKLIPHDPAFPNVFRFSAQYYERAIIPLDSFKVIVHEMGHTLGLEHTSHGPSGFGTGGGYDIFEMIC